MFLIVCRRDRHGADPADGDPGGVEVGVPPLLPVLSLVGSGGGSDTVPALPAWRGSVRGLPAGDDVRLPPFCKLFFLLLNHRNNRNFMLDRLTTKKGAKADRVVSTVVRKASANHYPDDRLTFVVWRALAGGRSANLR